MSLEIKFERILHGIKYFRKLAVYCGHRTKRFLGFAISKFWIFASEPLGAATLIIGLVLKGPDIYNLTAESLYNTRIDTAEERSDLRKQVQPILQKERYLEVSDSCVDQDDDCEFILGGFDKGTCYNFTKIYDLTVLTDDKITFVVGGQWMTETKYAKRIGPYVGNIKCDPVYGAVQYTCAMERLSYENLANKGLQKRNKNCSKLANKNPKSDPFEATFFIEIYLRSYFDNIAANIEGAIARTLAERY